jgi:hypothetical protein
MESFVLVSRSSEGEDTSAYLYCYPMVVCDRYQFQSVAAVVCAEGVRWSMYLRSNDSSKTKTSGP